MAITIVGGNPPFNIFNVVTKSRSMESPNLQIVHVGGRFFPLRQTVVRLVTHWNGVQGHEVALNLGPSDPFRMTLFKELRYIIMHCCKEWSFKENELKWISNCGFCKVLAGSLGDELAA
jgi:hypothetical protein